ncbi:MAG: hypothetical protein D6762_08055 [Candidatus Neomarinimicrobiota bacterium]|nr:MAG: hypothetical protein D6762_08055 [Candidatus Neomarinimicrobiota bacterium]
MSAPVQTPIYIRIFYRLGLVPVLAGVMTGQPMRTLATYSFPESLIETGFHCDQVEQTGSWFFMLDREHQRLVRWDGAEEWNQAGGFGQTEDSFFDPVGFQIDHLKMYVLDRGRQGWLLFDTQLHYIDFIPLPTDIDPVSFAVDAFGNLYVADLISHGVIRYSRSGQMTGPFIDFDLLPDQPRELVRLSLLDDQRFQLWFRRPSSRYILSTSGRLLTWQRFPEAVAGVLDCQGEGYPVQVRPDSVRIQSTEPVRFPVPQVQALAFQTSRLLIVTPTDIRVLSCE